MNDDRRLEQQVTSMLTSVAPIREPAALLDSVLATSSRTRQRPRWLAFSKETPMRLGANVAFGSPIARVTYLAILVLTVTALVAGGAAVGATLLSSPSPAIVKPTVYPPGPGTFNAGPDMAEPRGARAVRLLDGSVLVLGGATTERWDPETGAFHPAGAMLERKGGPAVPLDDGRVLVIGGQLFSPEPGGGPRVASVEIWDPSTETFSPASSLAQGEDPYSAVVLHDGHVLVIGGAEKDGTIVPFTKIWDPATGGFSRGGPMADASGGPSATLLQDGRVVAIDGRHAEVWDPVTNTFAEAGTLIHRRLWSSTVPLADGRVLVVGGPTSLGGSPAKQAEVWDPVTETFTDAGSMETGRYWGHSMTLLPDGRVLVAGGSLIWDGAPLASSEIWDSLTTTFSLGPDLSVGRGMHAAALLDDGTVLIAGGYTGDLDNPSFPTTTEIWVPGAGK